jgi:hypothetical protein
VTVERLTYTLKEIADEHGFMVEELKPLVGSAVQPVAIAPRKKLIRANDVAVLVAAATKAREEGLRQCAAALELGPSVEEVRRPSVAEVRRRNGLQPLKPREERQLDGLIATLDSRVALQKAAQEEERRALIRAIQVKVRGRDLPPSYVYFIGGDVGCIKIGTSTIPEQRLKTLHHSSPVPLRILALVEGDRWVEKDYHDRFAEHRRHGEWFDRAPELMREIETLAAANDHLIADLAA